MDSCQVVADRLLKKIAQAAEELDVQYVTDLCREKEMIYTPGERKPSREILRESQNLRQVRTTVDRAGLKQLIAGLKDLQDIRTKSRGSDDACRQLEVRLEGVLKDYGS